MSKLVLAILSSVWFFPVSCTSFGVAGSYFSSWYGTRYVNEGQTPHSFFYVLIESDVSGQIEPISIHEYKESHIEQEKKSIKLSKMSGVVEFETGGGAATIHYNSIERKPESVIYELIYSGPNSHAWWSYSVSSSGLQPISSRILAPGNAVASIIVAIPLAIFVYYFFGYLLRRRQNAA